GQVVSAQECAGGDEFDGRNLPKPPGRLRRSAEIGLARNTEGVRRKGCAQGGGLAIDRLKLARHAMSGGEQQVWRDERRGADSRPRAGVHLDEEDRGDELGRGLVPLIDLLLDGALPKLLPVAAASARPDGSPQD